MNQNTSDFFFFFKFVTMNNPKACTCAERWDTGTQTSDYGTRLMVQTHDTGDEISFKHNNQWL